MINYSFMTLQQAYDYLMIRLANMRSDKNTDWSTAVTCINRAIREAMLAHLPYKEWTNNYTMVVTHRLPMPANFLSPIRVMLSIDGNPPYLEARAVNAREFQSINSWYNRNIWNQGINFKPSYTLWGETINTVRRTVIHLSPNADFETGTAPTGHVYNGVTVSGLMEYYAAPPFITLTTDILPIPYEVEELVILLALERLMSKSAELDEVTRMHILVEKEKSRLFNYFQEKERTSKRELTSFIEPTLPLVPSQPQPGELPSEGRR